MASVQDARDDLAKPLGCLIVPALDDLAAQLAMVKGLGDGERAAVMRATEAVLLKVLHDKLSRVLLLELHAARADGRLQGASPAERWADFIGQSSQRSYWDSLAPNYPTLLPRITRLVENRCAGALSLARHFAADRASLAPLIEGHLGALTALGFGAGDSHHAGKTVALLHCEGGTVVYKPRSVAVDAELKRFVQSLPLAHPCLRVPRVIDRGDHGWAEFISHRHAADDGELRRFYRGIGQWLAVMRALGGSDLHAENLIAHGPWPVVVDCETLFSPKPRPAPSDLGAAFDLAAAHINGSVMDIGLLPGRGSGLGWRGIDPSGVGALPDQQPLLPQLGIVDAGTDQARLETMLVKLSLARQNHPAPQPPLERYWPEVLEGFDEASTTLRHLDRAGALTPRLEAFARVPIRVVTRATEAYAELMRMLWHPVSLHEPEGALRQARELLAKMGANRPLAPDDQRVIEAEVDDLLDGDVPFFATRPCDGCLDGPRGTAWLPATDLIEDTLKHWRGADLSLERRMIQAALVNAYASDGATASASTPRPPPDTHRLEPRRRAQAARIMRRLMDTRIAGEDGSVTWVASTLNATGMSIQPLALGLYSGLNGIAIAVAAYLREADSGHADPVPGLDGLLSSLLETLRRIEQERVAQRRKVGHPRPPAPGGYVGLGSEIWTWLTLAQWGVAAHEGIERARALASLLPAAAAADEVNDILAGKAGAILPLLKLARTSGERQYLDMAVQVGDQLREAARRQEGRACWVHPRWPQGLGGYAHGAMGIGWALARLAQASGEERFAALSDEALAFESDLFMPDERNWRDLRGLQDAHAVAAWCHGAVGVGLALADLFPSPGDTLSHRHLEAAVEATWKTGFEHGHGICHGDLGAWELLDLAVKRGMPPFGATREHLLATVVTSLEQNGPVCGSASPDFSPGLMSGLAGIAYQLLKARPGSGLPSVMIMDDSAAV